MPAKKSKPTEDPWSKLDAMILAEPEPTGPDWFTIGQFSSRYGKSYAWGAQICREWHRKGKLERWQGTKAGKPGLLNKYRLVP